MAFLKQVSLLHEENRIFTQLMHVYHSILLLYALVQVAQEVLQRSTRPAVILGQLEHRRSQFTHVIDFVRIEGNLSLPRFEFDETVLYDYPHSFKILALQDLMADCFLFRLLLY